MTTIATLSPLSSPEQRKLAFHEEGIEKNKLAFLELGRHLLAIRDGKLYRAEFGTFEEYCKKKLSFATSYAYRLMDSAKVEAVLSPIGDTETPTNEAQFRILAAIPTPQKQADVWVKAVATAPHGKVTAAHVRKVANEMAGKSKTEVEDEEADINANPDWCRACKRPAGDGTCDRCITIAAEIEDSPDDPTDISESPTPARNDVHGLTPQAVDEAMSRLQKQERDKAAATEQPKPAEPNTIGELNHDIDYFVLARVSDQPPHIRMAAADNLEVLAKKVRAI